MLSNPLPSSVALYRHLAVYFLKHNRLCNFMHILGIHFIAHALLVYTSMFPQDMREYMTF